MKKIIFYLNELRFKIFMGNRNYLTYEIKNNENLKEIEEWLKVSCRGTYEMVEIPTYNNHYRWVGFAQKSDMAMFKLVWGQLTEIKLNY
jgi:hypothetical protein